MPETITREELQRKLDTGEQFHLIEVLAEKEYQRLHIKGAMHIPFNRIGAEARQRFGKDEEIVVYCMDHDCRASPMAAEKLEELGYTNISVFRGGKQEWSEAGLPTEGEEA